MGTRCLVIGVGKMGLAHLGALVALGPDALAGWAPSSRRRESVEATGAEFLEGSLDDALRGFQPSHVIVASPIATLAATTLAVLASGVRQVLVEKPAALSVTDGKHMASAATARGARVCVGYNRRFYGSVRAALARMRRNAEQVQSVCFEFNEMIADPAGPPGQLPEVRSRWVLANSLHVIDMALWPVGAPDAGKSRLLVAGATAWHPSGSMFVGAGETERGIPFAYHANWNGPGRWSVEWVTRSERYVFRPLEQLTVLGPGGTLLDGVECDDALDRRFKPGVYLQDKAFLEDREDSGLCGLIPALRLLELGIMIGGYGAD